MDCHEPSADQPLGSVLVEDRFGAQFGPSHKHQGSAEAATKCGSLCSSKQVAQGQSWEASDIDLHHSTSLEATEQTSEQSPITLTSHVSKGISWQTPEPAEANSNSCDQ